MILSGRGQLSTDHKQGVRRFGILFDWGLEHYFASECPPSTGPRLLYPQYLTDEHSLTFQTLQKRETPWWKYISLSLGFEVKPLLTHIPALCHSECCYYKEGASSL